MRENIGSVAPAPDGKMLGSVAHSPNCSMSGCTAQHVAHQAGLAATHGPGLSQGMPHGSMQSAIQLEMRHEDDCHSVHRVG